MSGIQFGFTLEHVLAGRKTETRRLNRRSRWTIGKTYAAQPGRGQPAAGRVLATGYRVEALGAIDEASAKAEGFDSRQAFIKAWTAAHGRFDPGQLVHVYSFELFEEVEP
jgi:hypothetical protein